MPEWRGRRDHDRITHLHVFAEIRNAHVTRPGGVV
jgi:hypothetical protein